MTVLALKKYRYKLRFSDGSTDIISTDRQWDPIDIVQVNKVFQFGHLTFSGHLCSRMMELDGREPEFFEGKAYAISIETPGLREVALERVRSYRQNIGGEIDVDKLQKRLQWFMREGSTNEKLYKIYLDAGGDPRHIG